MIIKNFSKQTTLGAGKFHFILHGLYRLLLAYVAGVRREEWGGEFESRWIRPFTLSLGLRTETVSLFAGKDGISYSQRLVSYEIRPFWFVTHDFYPHPRHIATLILDISSSPLATLIKVPAASLLTVRRIPLAQFRDFESRFPLMHKNTEFVFRSFIFVLLKDYYILKSSA